MKKQITTLFFLGFLGFHNFALSACIPAQKNEYISLNSAIALQQSELKKTLLSKYCFKLDYYVDNKIVPSVFFAHNANDIKLFTDQRIDLSSYKSGRYQLDLLSHVLLRLNLDLHIPNDEKNMLYNLGKQYLPNLSKESFNNKAISYSEYSDLLSAIVTNYNTSYHLPLNIQNNSPLAYAIIANEPKVLNDLVNTNTNRKTFLYRKNKAGIAPIHLAFANKRPFMKNNQQENTNLVNSILVNNLSQDKINYLNLENISFFELAEIFKNENIDFYNKLQNKFHFSVNISKYQKDHLFKNKLQERLNFVNANLDYEKN